MKSIQGLTAFALSLFSAVCLAQSSPEDPSKHTGTAGQGDAMTGDSTWDDLDSNKDGFLTKDELTGSPALVTHFKDGDSNGDGKISPQEWSGWGKDGDSK